MGESDTVSVINLSRFKMLDHNFVTRKKKGGVGTILYLEFTSFVMPQAVVI